jgi:hypothetical protein
VQIDILHVPDCPNLEVARSRVHAALERARIEAVIREFEVGSIAAAVGTGMSGSPTILIDGSDPFAQVHGSPSVSCRLYRTEQGLDGAPSVEQLTEAVRAAAARTEQVEEA